jgi:hypothetical protein
MACGQENAMLLKRAPVDNFALLTYLLVAHKTGNKGNPCKSMISLENSQNVRIFIHFAHFI